MKLNFLQAQSGSLSILTPLKTQNGMDETQFPFELKVSFFHSL